MEVQNNEKFIKVVESLIDPSEVSNLLFFQKLKKLLPSFLLKRLLNRASKKTPYIGFVIEPYSLFLFFKLRDIELAKSLLPDRYELAKATVFAGEEPDYYLGLGNLSTRASTFWGVRQEAYLIARDKRTGLLSWIFIGILSNTVIALPTKGIVDPNCKTAVFTTNPKGEIFLEIEETGTEKRFELSGRINGGRMRKLNESLWLMGNTSIGHSKDLADGDDMPFAVIFDPAEVDEAIDIPIEHIDIKKNTLFPRLAEPEPCKIVCFPFAQHYIADSPGCHTYVKDRNDMISKYNKLSESENMRTFSAKTIVAQLSAGIAFSVLVIALLLLLVRA